MCLNADTDRLFACLEKIVRARLYSIEHPANGSSATESRLMPQWLNLSPSPV
ncbi:hypothetical protein [Stenomitos frigidus]|uniref:hypothetical protein n=1 Tax=Stenomitos frigidus TaxID=1886765 RepID=UPI0015E70AE6|nr:hypothetical protein [Stenomitos frigidus]